MNWLYENRTKILGVLTAVVSAIAVMNTGMTFEGLLEPETVRWIAIVCNLVATALGVLTTGVGVSNTTAMRVASAEAQVATVIKQALDTPLPPPSAIKAGPSD